MKQNRQLMVDADGVFWQELNNLDGYPGERYLVVDSFKHEVVVESAVLTKDKKTTRV